MVWAKPYGIPDDLKKSSKIISEQFGQTAHIYINIFFSCLNVFFFLIYINIYVGMVTPAIDPFEVSGRQRSELGLGFTSVVVLVLMLSHH
jgi:hypothetical protein